MKSPILLLPTLMLCGCTMVLAAQTAFTSRPETQSARNDEVRELRLQRKAISDRLERLEGESHHFIPRGGLSSNDPAVEEARLLTRGDLDA